MSNQTGTAPPSDADTSTEETDRPTEPTEQEVFDILSNRRRRYALYALLDDDTATIGSLAEQIAAWENDCTVPEVTPTERKRVYTALQQSHLPKLERTGLISFDRESGRVRPTNVVGEMDIYLEVVGEEQLSWTQYYLGLSAVAVGIVAAVWLELPPFRAVSPLLWLTFVVGLFAVSATIHNYRSAGFDAASEPPEVSRRS
jgi:DNA-binding transcriptional ArsR family regulator